MSKNKHSGSSLDEFLEEENLLAEADSLAMKRVLAHKLEVEMKKLNLSKRNLASMMDTSRASLDRLLDPDNTSVTLHTMVKAAAAMHKRINISFL